LADEVVAASRQSAAIFGDNMRERALVAIIAVLLLLGISRLLLRQLPHKYYRYQNGVAYVVSNPNAVWNELGRGPCLQFEIPLFASRWKPGADQIKKAISDQKLKLSDKEIEQIISECVSR